MSPLYKDLTMKYMTMSTINTKSNYDTNDSIQSVVCKSNVFYNRGPYIVSPIRLMAFSKNLTKPLIMIFRSKLLQIVPSFLS